MRHTLYQPDILDHSQKPRYKTRIATITHSAEGYNQNCGDYIKIDVHIANNTIVDLAAHCECCAICKASASILAEIITGKNTAYFIEQHKYLEAILSDKTSPGAEKQLKTFNILNHFPTRKKCAQLPWQTLFAALNKKPSTTTEHDTNS